MILNRLTKSGLDKLDQSMFSTGVRLPNCTTYCILEYWENGGERKPLFKGRSDKGFPNAKEWYSDYLFDKGVTPRENSFLVWGSSGSTYGHVAYCLEVSPITEESWTVKVAQSNYKGNYFEVKDYQVKKGAVTSGVGMAYIGSCYLDLPDSRTHRDGSKFQVEVLADMLTARKSPDGEKYEGRYVPKGIYNVDEAYNLGYMWFRVGDVWFASNDEQGWTITYPIDDNDWEARYEELREDYDLVVKQCQILEEKIIEDEAELKSKNKLIAAIKELVNENL